MNPDVIEAMCRAYWDERGSTKWKNEGEQYRESIRCRMRAAVKALVDLNYVTEPGALRALTMEDMF